MSLAHYLVKIMRNRHVNTASALLSPISEASIGDLSKKSYLKETENIRLISDIRLEGTLDNTNRLLFYCISDRESFMRLL